MERAGGKQRHRELTLDRSSVGVTETSPWFDGSLKSQNESIDWQNKGYVVEIRKLSGKVDELERHRKKQGDVEILLRER